MNCKKLGIKSVLMAIVINCLPLSSYAGFFKDLGDNITIQQNQQGQSSDSSQHQGNFAIGNEYAGGIIFYLDDSGNHGLVASDADIRGTRSWDEAMMACSNYKKNGFSDWSLPDVNQLAQLYLRRDVVGGWVPNMAYWSSSESDIPNCAWLQYFSTGSQYKNRGKNYLFYARCVRGF